MIEKGPDSTNPLALIGSAVLGSFGTWIGSLLWRKRDYDHEPSEDKENGCASKSDLRSLKSELGGDISYIRVQIAELDGRILRMIREGHAGHGEQSGRGD